MIVFDFEPQAQDGKTQTSEGWSLWLRCTPWRLRAGQQLLLGSEDSREEIAAGILQLEHRVIARCEFDIRTLDLCVEFDAGLCLETFSFARADYEHWSLRTPDGMVLIAGPGF